MVHPLRLPRLAFLVPIALGFRDGGMGVVVSKFLAMVTIIFGLFTIVAPLCAMFRMTAIVSALRRWQS